MEYDFVLSIGDPAPDASAIHTTDWHAYPRLERSYWSVDPGTITTQPTGIHVVVVTKQSIEPADAFTIGRELHSTLFYGTSIHSLLYREAGPERELGAAPGEIKVCLRCGGHDGNHNPPCTVAS